MLGARGICKECGEEFFIASENCGCDESLCEDCFNMFYEENENDNQQFQETRFTRS